jgi:nitroreductase
MGNTETMDAFEAVRTVLAVRRYQTRDVPKHVVRNIIEAARLTGSSMNAQPWHFVVVTDRDMLRRLGGVLRTGPYVADAAFAVVVAVAASSRFAVSDASRAIQSMVVAAWGDGVGSNWVGFGGLREVAAMLAVPDDYDVLAVVAFGYPTRERFSGRKDRKPLSAVASAERFGRPFE